MKAAFTVLKEQIQNFYLIRRLSAYEIKSQNRNNYLGIAWEVINPSIQLVIYWFVFGTLRDRAPVEINGLEVPFFSWLVAGFFIWTFCFQSIIQGSKSIYTRLRMLSKMNFPMSIIPNIVIFSKLYIHLAMLGIAIVILHVNGYYITIYYAQLIYFTFAAVCLMFAISLITSTISTIIRDAHLLLNSTFRMMFYVSGVLWPITRLDDFPTLLKLMQLNPLYYLIEGYRAALFGVDWYFITNWQYTLTFWGFVLVTLIIGSVLHVKFRRHFIDYL